MSGREQSIITQLLYSSTLGGSLFSTTQILNRRQYNVLLYGSYFITLWFHVLIQLHANCTCACCCVMMSAVPWQCSRRMDINACFAYSQQSVSPRASLWLTHQMSEIMSLCSYPPFEYVASACTAHNWLWSSSVALCQGHKLNPPPQLWLRAPCGEVQRCNMGKMGIKMQKIERNLKCALAARWLIVCVHTFSSHWGCISIAAVEI